VLKPYKYRIYPNKEQREIINSHIGVSRFVYNLALETKINAYDAGLKLSEFDLNNQLTELKQDYTWIKEVNAQTLQQAVKNLNSAYQSFFKGGGFPKFKSKTKSTKSYRVMSQGVKVDFGNGTIKLPKIKQPIRCKFDRTFKSDIRNVTISCSKTGKYFVSVLIKNKNEMLLKYKAKKENSIGIDVGLNHFLVTSTGEFIDNPRYLRGALDRIKVLQRRLRNKKKGSSNLRKAWLEIAKLYDKVSNQRKDFLHKLTTQIVADNQGAIIVEDLNIKGMSKNHKLALSIADASWSEFFRQLEYKCKWYGRVFIKIDRWYPSTKLCNGCGTKNTKLELKDREWTCVGCSEVLDRDLNASLNILDEGLKKYNEMCGNIYLTGLGKPVVPVEMSSIDESMKQECSLSAYKAPLF